MITNIKRKLKKLKIQFTGEYKFITKEIKIKHLWYGKLFSGFFVCPDYLNENSIVYSFGIGEDISFDEEIISKHKCKVFGFDPTPKSIEWIKKYNISENFFFKNYGISSITGKVDFYLPKNSNHVSGSSVIQDNVNSNEKIEVEMKTLTDIMIELGHNQIDVLKMDIEGAEYEVLENIINSNIKIHQILVEFHDRYIKNGKQKTKEIIEKLKSNNYKIFAISDSYEEISFINTSY